MIVFEISHGRKKEPEALLQRFANFSTSDAFTSVITVLMSSTKETKDGFKIHIEQLPLND
jgi:hypothetical protein